MEDLLIVTLIPLFIFLFGYLIELKREDNKHIKISYLITIIGFFVFLSLQFSVSNYDVFKQNEFDDLKKEVSIWCLLISFIIAILFYIFSKNIKWFHYVFLMFEIIFFLLFAYMKLISYAFI